MLLTPLNSTGPIGPRHLSASFTIEALTEARTPDPRPGPSRERFGSGFSAHNERTAEHTVADVSAGYPFTMEYNTNRTPAGYLRLDYNGRKPYTTAAQLKP